MVKVLLTTLNDNCSISMIFKFPGSEMAPSHPIRMYSISSSGSRAVAAPEPQPRGIPRPRMRPGPLKSTKVSMKLDRYYWRIHSSLLPRVCGRYVFLPALHHQLSCTPMTK